MNTNKKNLGFKPIAILLMASVIALSAASVRAFTAGDFEYSLNSSDQANLTATVTRYNGSASNVDVPGFVDVPEKYKDDDGEEHTRFIPYRVVGIDRYVFSGKTAITSISLPSSVWFISNNAFMGCSSLNNFSFDNISWIGGEAFKGCTSLTSVRTSTKTSYYGGCVFSGCTALLYAEINGNGNCVIPGGTGDGGFFQSCSSLETCIIGNGISGITSTGSYGASGVAYMFSGCSSLREVDFGSLVDIQHAVLANHPSLEICHFPAATSIGSDQFRGCTALREVTALDNIVNIGASAFSGCVSLTGTLNLPQTRSIGASAFAGCTGFSGSLDLPQTRSIGNAAFANCTGFTSVITTENMSNYGAGIFNGCTGLVSVVINGDGGCVLQGGKADYGGFFQNCSSLVVCKLGNGIVGITSSGSYGGTAISSMFYGCNSLREVDFGGVTDLYHACLVNHTSLEICHFPSATAIGNDQFRGCTALREITSLDRILSIGASAFSGCTGLTGTINLPQARTIGGAAFVNCTAITGVITSDNMASYGPGLFSGCTSLVSAVINGNGGCVLQGGKADYGGFFQNCSSLVVCKLGNGITGITSSGSYGGTATSSMFYGCNSLREVDFGGVTDLQHAILANHPSLEICHFPSATAIGSSQFSNCNGLREITALDNIVSIGASAFSGCTGLTGALNLPRVRSIGQSAFTGCTGFSGALNLPQTTSIGNAAFENCSSLTEVSTTENMVSYGAGIFAGCTSLVSVVINGDGSCVLYGGKADYRGFFQNCLSLQTCKFGSGISGITSSGYYGGTRVYDMFSGCSSLREVDFGGVADLQHASLANHPSLETCYFPSASTIPANMFSGCVGLHEMTSMDNILNIGGSAFSGCSNLVMELSLPAVKNIDSRAFSDCRGLTGVVELAAIVSMGDRVFQNCSGIRAVNFGEDVSKLSEWGFTGSTNLVAFSFEGVQPPDNVNNNAFGGVARGAFGVYPMSRLDYDTAGVKLSKVRLMASESTCPSWEDQIDANGMWKGLIMGANKPILTNDAYYVNSGALHLNWENEKAPMPPTSCGVTYEVRRGFTDSYEAAEVLTNGYDQLAYEDKQFDFTGGVSRIWYWVKPEHEYVKFETSNSCRTKNRYGFSIGFSSYSSYTDKGLSYMNADAFYTAAKNKGEFDMYLLANSNGNLQYINYGIQQFSAKSKPGDIFVFFCATHGAAGTQTEEPFLLLDNAHLSYSQLVSWAETFTQRQVRFVGIISSCHAQALINGGHLITSSEILQNIEECGLRQCGAYSAYSGWIAACQTDQSSYKGNGALYNPFTEAFVIDGWKYGYGDVDLCIEGNTEHIDGHNDGRLTFLELAQYAKTMAIGFSKRETSTVIFYGESLLSRIDVGDAGTDHVSGKLDAPHNPRVVKNGLFKNYVYWDPVAGATKYRLWKCATVFNDAVLWDISYDTAYYRDINPFASAKYCVQAVNPAGISVRSDTVQRDNADGGISGNEIRAFLGDNGVDTENIGKMSDDDLNNIISSDLDGDGVTVGEEVISGVSPFDRNSQFTANITIENGEAKVTPNPDLGERRVYTTYGKKALDGNVGWVDMATVPEDEKAEYHFFKIGVSLP